MKRHFIVPVIVTSTIEYDIIAETEEEAMMLAEQKANENDLSHGSNINYEANSPVDIYEE